MKLQRQDLIRGESRGAGSEDAPSISSIVDDDNERVDEVPEYVLSEAVDDSRRRKKPQKVLVR